MKKVIAINGSYRKKNTYMLLKQAGNILEKNDIEMDYIDIKDYNIEECIGCQACITKGSCFKKDDVQLLMDKLKEYDGIIIGTPVYMNNLSGKLKVFFDRTCKWYHRPELVGKPVLVVAATAGSGLKYTFETVNRIIDQWGAFPAGSVGRTFATIKNEVSYDEIKRFIYLLNIEKENYKISLKQLSSFQVQRVLAENLSPLDKEYWEKNGWIGKDYYYDGKISFIKRLCCRSLYKFLSKKIKPVN